MPVALSTEYKGFIITSRMAQDAAVPTVTIQSAWTASSARVERSFELPADTPRFAGVGEAIRAGLDFGEAVIDGRVESSLGSFPPAPEDGLRT